MFHRRETYEKENPIHNSGPDALTDAAADGGVYVKSGGVFEMKSGTIETCKSEKAGGVYMDSSAEFSMSGGKLESCRNRTMDEVIGDGASTTGATTIYTAESSEFTISGSARIGPGTSTATNIQDLLIAGKLYANGGVVEGTVQCGSGIAAAGSSITEFTSSIYVDGGILNGIFGSDVTVNGDISTGT